MLRLGLKEQKKLFGYGFNQLIRSLTLTSIFFQLLGCSTLHKTAEEMMDKESFDEAISTYETILRRSPDDTDAIAGLRSAKEKYLDKRLIQIRLARIGNNHEQSWDMLLDLVKRERTWNFYPTGKVTFSQEEETRLALDQIKLYVDRSLNDQLPLKAEHALKKYNTIFEKTFHDEYVTLEKRTNQAGRAKCQSYQNALNKKMPFYSQFIVRFCEYFGNSNAKSSRDTYYNLNEFIAGLNLENHLTKNQIKISDAWDTLMTQSMQNATESTAWKHPQGKLKPRIRVVGKLVEVNTKEKVNLIHEYQVFVPYEKVEPIKVRRVVSQKGTLQAKDPYTGVMTQVPVQESREYEEVTESRRTELRSDLRTFAYEGMKVSQGLNIEAEFNADLLTEKISTSYINSIQNVSLTHDLNLPLVKLEPKPLKLPHADSWFQNEIQRSSEVWSNLLVSEWLRRFCNEVSASRSVLERGDAVLKCVRQTQKSYPIHAENWFEDYLGVSVSEFKDLFVRID